MNSRLVSLLAELSGVPQETIHPQMPIFKGGLELDSLSGTNLVAALGTEFGIGLDDLDLALDALDTVGSLSRLVDGKEAPDKPPSNGASEGSGAGRSASAVTDAGSSASAGDRAASLKELAAVAQAARLKEGPAGVERVLARIAAQPGLTSRELATDCALPTPTVSALRKELVKAGLVEEAGKGARATDRGIRLIHRYTMAIARHSKDSHNYNDYSAYRELHARLTEALTPIMSGRPSADTSLDQAKCLPQTAAGRALLALEYNVLLGRRIALVGDDDFTSIALGFLGKMLAADYGKAEPESIIVLDIDSRVLGTIESVACDHRLPIVTRRLDMRDELPADLLGGRGDSSRDCSGDYGCDAFFTDPPYTVAGARLFVSRGLSMCKRRGSMAFFSFAAKGPEEMLTIHREFSDMGLLVREVLPGFNRYEGASLWGNQSQLIVFEAVDVTAEAVETIDASLSTDYSRAMIADSTKTVQPQPSSQGKRYEGPLYTADFKRSR